jgi:hypothetical protein
LRPTAGDHFFAVADPNDAAFCGETITRISCSWGANGSNLGCHFIASDSAVQACL